ncbi:hypothetical protein L7F22_061151 [Adiantum nelumboides]|nr:hypothetical protein [Adiantum nelumboides]
MERLSRVKYLQKHAAPLAFNALHAIVNIGNEEDNMPLDELYVLKYFVVVATSHFESMATPSGDARVSKKQKKAQESTPAEIASSTQVAPIHSGHSEEAQGIEKTLPMVPSQRTIGSSRAGLLATSQRQRKPSVQDVQSTWEHARQRKREGHAWSIRVGVFGENRTIVEPFTPFLCVVENKGPINEESVFKLTFRQAFVEFQDNLYNLKGASEDDSSFKASDESEDSDNSNFDDGRDVEEITPSSFGRELVEHEKMLSLFPLVLVLPPLLMVTLISMMFVRGLESLTWLMKGLSSYLLIQLIIHLLIHFFQLAFRDGDLWEHQEEIFKLWEEGKVKGQRVKLPTSAQRSRGGSEETLKPIPEDMKITPWRSMQGIQEKHIILSILARVKGGALSLDEMSKEFEKQKTFLYMQHIMIEKLNCKDWNEVQTHHPTTSHHSALERFIFLFKSGVTPIKSIPQEFEQHLGRARAERTRLEDVENIVNNPNISTFVSDDITTLPVQYSVFEGKVENMESFVPRRHYTLGIADAPYGFKAPHSINDDVKYGLSTYKKVIEAFKKVTSAESWVLVIFHAHDQISAVEKAFVDNSMVHQLCIWTKPNIKCFQLDRLFFAAEFATIGFFSPIGLSCKGTTTVSALKKGQNVVVVEMDPLQPNLVDAIGGSGHGDGGGEDDSSPSGGEDEEHEEFPIKS